MAFAFICQSSTLYFVLEQLYFNLALTETNPTKYLYQVLKDYEIFKIKYAGKFLYRYALNSDLNIPAGGWRHPDLIFKIYFNDLDTFVP